MTNSALYQIASDPGIEGCVALATDGTLAGVILHAQPGAPAPAGGVLLWDFGTGDWMAFAAANPTLAPHLKPHCWLGESTADGITSAAFPLLA